MNKQQAFLMGMAAAKPRVQYVDRDVNVTVNRAPTDESVALLKEMEEASREKILASIPLQSNAVSGHIVVWRDSFTDVLTAAFTGLFNGKRLEVGVSVNYHDKETLIQKLMNETARTLAVEILEPPFNTLSPEIARAMTRPLGS